MSIHLIDQSISESIRSRSEPASSGKPPGKQFAQQLEQITQGTKETPVSVSATVELLRLEMMRSAISLCRDDAEITAAPAAATNAIQGLLQLFRNNSGDEGAGPEAVGESPTPASQAAAAPVTVAPHATLSVDSIVQKAAVRFGVDEALIKAVIKAESNFNPNAVSHAGAQGLMQLMPATARGVGVSNPFDPEQNVMGGTKFLKAMLNRYGGNVDAALAAYNWGPGNVDRQPAALPRETRNYLVKVKAYYAEFTG